MTRTGPPCPLCGRSGVYTGVLDKIYIPPANHARAVLTWTAPQWALLTRAGSRSSASVYDLCPLLDDEIALPP